MTLPRPKPYLAQITPYIQGKSSMRADITPVKLSSNENAHGPSPKALEAYAQASRSLHRYPEGSCAALRQALADTHTLDASRILCGTGSDELINLLIGAYAGQGDEVLFTEHAFLMYKLYTLSHGATPVEAPEKALTANVDALLAAVSEHTKIVFIANPNNPTGTYLPLSELTRLRAELPSHIILAIDGAYAECADAADYDDGLSLARNADNAVMLRTFSKLYGLPGLRLGWMTSGDTIIDAVGRLKSPFNITVAAQAAGLAAVHDTDYLRNQQQHNSQQRAWMTQSLQALGLEVIPSQGNFVLVNFGSAQRQQYIINGLEADHIYIRDVTAYKLPSYGRITIGTVAENARCVEAIKTLLNS